MWKRKKQRKPSEQPADNYEKKSIPIEKVRKAVNDYASQLPKGVELSVIIKNDLTIDYDLIAPYLKGIPTETYYMSRETYEIFPAADRQLAIDLDHVQKAVDNYMKQTKELPVIDSDPYKRVNYFKLERLNLLPYRPVREFYITEDEFLIDYRKPS
ncbi:DUF3939 domain-containing protein [Thalassobacillus pellis]|uniref:DUF3939 domain-containing protein n=1 Tax=Thalassobacillus pellis TaxID=748008 RepID=UPI0019601A36|nr:DUF3939 domain-containing protein [Thalassobacillus pellis]MBM7554105.1 hypothetical protein [Thalassobacillus pellis]